jgi:hypothetical protein
MKNEGISFVLMLLGETLILDANSNVQLMLPL